MTTTDPIQTHEPIPGFWVATFGDFDLGDPQGTGKTEAEAVEDLKDQVEYEEYDEARGLMWRMAGMDEDTGIPTSGPID